mmetsp:Transcript_23641/g.73639  ORF Transcript_23641/g.73639 Transcript_23641/m.73639 type:complete len:314 (+) Transcript_23641:2-943(+)
MGLGQGLGQVAGWGPGQQVPGPALGLGAGSTAGLSQGLAAPVALHAPPLGTPRESERGDVEPLAPGKLVEAVALLQAAGGAMALGRVTRQLRGVKKAQLAQHFELRHDDGELDLVVALPGTPAGTCAPGPRKRARTEGAEAGSLAGLTEPAPEEAVPPLDATRVAEVMAFLEASGGSLPLGRLTRQFRGLKKAQLAQHFALVVTGNPQDPVVGLPGCTPDWPSPAKHARLEAAQAGAQTAVAEGGEREEVPPLEDTKLIEILGALAASGGTLPLGKLTRQFPGVKKSQLEPHLPVGWNAGVRDFLVGPFGGLV